MIDKLNTTLTIYTDIDYQYFRQDHMNGFIGYAQISPYDRLLPFQFRRGSDSAYDFEIELYKTSGKQDLLAADLTDMIYTTDLDINTRGQIDYLIYFGDLAFKSGYTMPCGTYYLKITSGDRSYYSEIFKIIDRTEGTDYFAANPDEGILSGDEILMYV